MEGHAVDPGQVGHGAGYARLFDTLGLGQAGAVRECTSRHDRHLHAKEKGDPTSWRADPMPMCSRL